MGHKGETPGPVCLLRNLEDCHPDSAKTSQKCWAWVGLYLLCLRGPMQPLMLKTSVLVQEDTAVITKVTSHEHVWGKIGNTSFDVQLLNV